MKEHINLSAKPFFLDEEAIRWVEQTKQMMSLEEKIGQLFCPIGLVTDEKQMEEHYLNYHVGAIMFRENQTGDQVAEYHRFLQENSKIPLLVAANLENGGCGIASDGTMYGSQMLVAATGRDDRAYELGDISGQEGKACGCNWAFAPVVDIDRNYHNPITNVRTYGSDARVVKNMARQYVRGLQKNGVAAAIKHFPGDGIDERDQHIVTSVNSLSCQEWDETYGMVYRALIEDGVKSVMVGHIALPSWQSRIDPLSEGIIPASQSSALLQGLLRGYLGFQGLITTDATQMVGFCTSMPRAKAVPKTIECGCDMFLFHRSLEEDYEYMYEGYQNGLLSEDRLDAAITRILALKASLGLHKDRSIPDRQERQHILSSKQHKMAARLCADEGITLVKDRQNILPITSARYPRILLEVMTNTDDADHLAEEFKTKLTREGFKVEIYQPEDTDVIFNDQRTQDFISRYDLVLYVVDMENKSNHTTCRLQWNTVYASNNQPWFVQEIPTIMISLANPYHLLDAPMIKTYINAYYNSPQVREMLIEKLMGRSPFMGENPIDPFCGYEDTKK